MYLWVLRPFYICRFCSLAGGRPLAGEYTYLLKIALITRCLRVILPSSMYLMVYNAPATNFSVGIGYSYTPLTTLMV